MYNMILLLSSTYQGGRTMRLEHMPCA